MPRRLFSRVFLQHLLVIAATLLAGGAALDRFLVRNEMARLGDQVERLAGLLQLDVSGLRGGPLQEAVRRRGEATGVRFTVVAGDGTVLADSLGDPATMENHASHPEVGEALSGKRARSLRRSVSLGIEMLYVALPGPPVVRAALPVAEVHAVLTEVRRRVGLAAVPAAAVALALAFGLSRSFTRRLRRMISFARRVARGDYSRELPILGVDELSDMERALCALREQIRDQVERLAADRRVLSDVLEGLPNAVLLLDGSRKVALANGPARTLLRLSAEEAVGLPAAEVLRYPQIARAIDAAAAGQPGPDPFPLSWPDPPSRLEVVVRSLFRDGDAPSTLVVLRDTTREYHLERVRSDFISNLSHELRTPLTAIRGGAETLLDAAPDPAAAKKFLESIRRNSARLESLLRDVSDLSRAESGLVTPEIRVFDGRAVVEEVVELFRTEAEKAGVSLEAECAEAPKQIRSDPELVESILVNLVQNAVRYTPRGGRVVVSMRACGRGVSFEVEDTGIGIPLNDLPRVTERFYRVDPGRSRAVGGTGLGLSIVKHLVETLGGELEIRSEQGKGTTVSVVLPGVAGTDEQA